MTSFVVRSAWIGLAALALLASLVNGRDNPRPRTHGAPDTQTGATQSRELAALAHDDFDLGKLRRQASDQPVRDLFPAPIPPPAPAPAPAPVMQVAQVAQVVHEAKPPAPTVPPLPFRYLGRAIEDGRTTVFVGRGKEHHSVSAGDTIGDDYRVSDINASAVTFTYLPMGRLQALAIPNAEPIMVQ
jgi:hypothetical protein